MSEIKVLAGLVSRRPLLLASRWTPSLCPHVVAPWALCGLCLWCLPGLLPKAPSEKV